MSLKTRTRQARKRERLHAGRVMAAAKPRELSKAQLALLDELLAFRERLIRQFAAADHQMMLQGFREASKRSE